MLRVLTTETKRAAPCWNTGLNAGSWDGLPTLQQMSQDHIAHKSNTIYLTATDGWKFNGNVWLQCGDRLEKETPPSCICSYCNLTYHKPAHSDEATDMIYLILHKSLLGLIYWLAHNEGKLLVALNRDTSLWVCDSLMFIHGSSFLTLPKNSWTMVRPIEVIFLFFVD